MDVLTPILVLLPVLLLAIAGWLLHRRRSSSLQDRTPAEHQAVREADREARRRGPGPPGADRTFGGGGGF